MNENHGFCIKHFKDYRICWDGELAEEDDVEKKASNKISEEKNPMQKILEIEDEQERDLVLWHPITRFAKF